MRWFGGRHRTQRVPHRHCQGPPDAHAPEAPQQLDACSLCFPTDLTRGLYLYLRLRAGHMTLVF